MAVAAGVPASAAAAEGAGEGGAGGDRWGIGWSSLSWTDSRYSGGPTLRGRFGSWQLGVAGRPNLSASESESHHSGLEGDSAYDYRRPSEYESRTGWAKLEACRDLWRRGRLSLGLLATGSWTRAQSERVELEHVDWSDPVRDRTRTSESRETSWGVGIGLRPRYALLERLTVDFDFGFGLFWWDRVTENWVVDHGLPEWERTRTTEEGTSFETVGGWHDLYSLNLIFWF